MITRIHLLAKYLLSLAFSSSYFHRAIRSGPTVSNPIVHIDTSPWEKKLLRICSCCKIGSELGRAYRSLFLEFCRLIRSLSRPQGAHYKVVSWVHRSSFTIRPPTRTYPPPPPNSRGQKEVPRIPTSETENTRCGMAQLLGRRRGPMKVWQTSENGVVGFEKMKVPRILREQRCCLSILVF